MNAHSLINQFEVFHRLGYEKLVPIVPPGAPISDRSSIAKRLAAGKDDRGKTPGMRNAAGFWHGFDWLPHEASPEDLVRWHLMGAGIGIKTGRLDSSTSLVLIDADTMNPEHARLIREAVHRHFGVLPVRIGRDPKAGYMARVRGELRYCRIEFGPLNDKNRLVDRVEILSDGRQFVAHGIHPATQRPYQWPNGVPALDDVPIVEAAALTAFLEDLRGILPAATPIKVEGASAENVNQEALRADPELVERAVRATPNTSQHFPSREDWRDFGYMIKAAMGPALEAQALALFQDWSDGWVGEAGEVNDPGYVEAEWSRFKPPFKAGAGKLFELAEQASGGAFNRAAQWFEAHNDNTPLFPEDPTQASSKRLSLVPFHEAAKGALTRSTKPLIKGVLDQGTMSVLYGESNVGKTFVAMDKAAHVAAGMAWAGKRTAQAVVVYVAAEGGVGAMKRAAAIEARHPNADFSKFLFRLSNVDLLRADADLQPLIATLGDVAAAHGPVGLVVVDTLSRAMAGGDENASTDMGALVRNLDAIRAATGAHLMVVHHTGKDRAKGARGHSLLRAATDTEIEVADGVISITKQRDIDKSFSSAFVLDVVTLGTDADGDPVTSCTVRLVSDAEAVAEAATAEPGLPTPKEREVLAALDALAEAADAFAGAGAADIAKAMFSRGVAATVDQVRFHLKSLVVKRVLRKAERGQFVRKEAVEGSKKVEDIQSSTSEKGQTVFD